ncbi:MAG: hypothetical protein WBV06_13095 [Acidimicrobiia bacterium]
MRRFFSISALAVAAVAIAAPAYAGGAQLEPSRVRVDAGEEIELSAHVSQGAFGWVEDGPFYVYLIGTGYGEITSTATGGTATDVPLGELSIDASGKNAEVFVQATIPAETPAGEYQVVVCNDPCTTGFGDLNGGALYVGIDPPSLEQEITHVPPSTAAVAIDVVVTSAAPAPRAAPAYMALAPSPERTTQISPLWVACSAALGAVVLMMALVSRDRS